MTARQWLAMQKFCDGEPLTAQEWDDLSWLTLIDRERHFELGNCRWVTTDAERADNLFELWRCCTAPAGRDHSCAR
jgi:hypothetical protein